MDAMPVAIDETYLVRTMQELVRIDSSNPALTPGSPGEEAHLNRRT
jgi:hypothetical protein